VGWAGAQDSRTVPVPEQRRRKARLIPARCPHVTAKRGLVVEHKGLCTKGAEKRGQAIDGAGDAGKRPINPSLAPARRPKQQPPPKGSPPPMARPPCFPRVASSSYGTAGRIEFQTSALTKS
jgi:hypothetical protein